MGRRGRMPRASHKARAIRGSRRAGCGAGLRFLPKLLAAFFAFILLLGGCTTAQKPVLPAPPNVTAAAAFLGHKETNPAPSESQTTKVKPVPEVPAPPKPPLPPSLNPPAQEQPAPQPAPAANKSSANKTKIWFYYSPYCPFSQRLMPLLDSLKQNYSNSTLDWEYVDVTTSDGYSQFAAMLSENGLSKAYSVVPFVVVQDTRLVGIGEISDGIGKLLADAASS